MLVLESEDSYTVRKWSAEDFWLSTPYTLKQPPRPLIPARPMFFEEAAKGQWAAIAVCSFGRRAASGVNSGGSLNFELSIFGCIDLTEFIDFQIEEERNISTNTVALILFAKCFGISFATSTATTPDFRVLPWPADFSKYLLGLKDHSIKHIFVESS